VLDHQGIRLSVEKGAMDRSVLDRPPAQFGAWLSDQLGQRPTREVFDELLDARRAMVDRRGVRADGVTPRALVSCGVGLARAAAALGRPQVAWNWLDSAANTGWLDGLSVDDCPGVAALRAAIEEPPAVVDGRFAPDPSSGEAFAGEAWVCCPRCGAPGVRTRDYNGSWWHTRPGRFVCSSCLLAVTGFYVRFGRVWATPRTGDGLRPPKCGRCGARIDVAQKVSLQGEVLTELPVRCPSCGAAARVPVNTRPAEPGDGLFGLPLLLQTPTPYGTLFAYNRRHLNQLRCYVGARFRDESGNRTAYDDLSEASWSATLPAWVKAAKNRAQMLAAVVRLDAIADRAGLSRAG
jgi:DNA-directed RNA polymerase subunit RPC12/RpoP